MSNTFMMGAAIGIIAGALMAENKQLKKVIDKGMQAVKTNMHSKSEQSGFSGCAREHSF